ncbi:MAG: hypothetical protein MUF18_17535 [Fimbriiglobus sp.]|nr:hypothetical protein [Fimbriiglobus sp.]
MRGNGRKLAAAVAVGLGLSVAPAQTPPIETAQKKLQATETALAGEVSDALRLAPGVAKVDVGKAVRMLKDVRTKVDTAIVTEKKREELVRQLNDAIAAIGNTSTIPLAPPKADATLLDRAVRNEKNQKLIDAAKLEAKEVAEAITAIAADVENRREADAKRKLTAIAAKYPNNPALLLFANQRSIADSIADARDIATLSADRFTRAMNDVQRSAIPPIGDIEFPKDWKEKMERRRKLNAPQLSPDEEKLLRSLDAAIARGLKDAPFQEAVQLLSTTIDQKIYVDTKSLEARGVNLDDKVDVPGGVSARSALRIMLQTKGLTFVLREGVIQVVTVEEAKRQCVARAYDVRDLVSGGGAFNNPLVWGPYIDAVQTEANARIIIDSIKKGVEPAAWEENGGVGSVTFHYPTMSIIVRAPSEVHADLYRKMNK